jgi:SpoU rRNA methylase family enzyme
MTAGYSGTPLAKKLGLKEGQRVLLIDEPDDYLSLLQPLPASLSVARQAGPAIDLLQLFVVRKELR